MAKPDVIKGPSRPAAADVVLRHAEPNVYGRRP